MPKDKIKHQAYCQKYRENHREKVLFGQARYRAKKKGIEFNLDVSDIVIPKLCPVLKIPLLAGSSSGGPRGCSPSLDRVDNTKGYIKGNVQVMSHKANTMKHCATNKELLLFSNWIKRTYRKVIDE
jgi:hypothetical protein|tara:strand:+ start:107 stop:484 length:378 start_codon:yes stop_codon:yes gene_type:complete